MLTNAIWEQVPDRQQVFAGMAAWGGGAFDLPEGGQSRYAAVLFVSGGYFEMLGVWPAAGRLPGPADDVKGCSASQAVISHALAQHEFGGRSAVGRQIRLEGRTFEIAGVTQSGFFGVDVGRTFDVAVPLCAEPHLGGDSSSLDMPAGWFLPRSDGSSQASPRRRRPPSCRRSLRQSFARPCLRRLPGTTGTLIKLPSSER